MILTVFPFLLKVTTIILSSYDTNNKTKSNSQNNILRKNSSKAKYAILTTFVIYLPSIFLKSYIYTKIKWYMDKKYISSHKLLIIYGLMGTLVYSIVCTISTFKECEKTTETTETIVDYFCEVQDIN